MSEPFLSEIKMCAFNFAPTGWATCDGQVMNIQQNQALYALIGTFYGGNGTTSFQLPDLRGRTPLHMSPSYGIGTNGGNESVTLTTAQIPAHTHTFQTNAVTPTANLPTSNVVAKSSAGYQTYGDVANLTAMNAGCLSSVGGSSHSNVQPTLVVNFCIALSGVWPSRS
ncbi:MAG: phage tail protein [Candidatus Omnitrophota bacterium]